MTCNNTTDASTLLRARAEALRATEMRGCATIGEWSAAYQQAEHFDIAADWLEQQYALGSPAPLTPAGEQT